MTAWTCLAIAQINPANSRDNGRRFARPRKLSSRAHADNSACWGNGVDELGRPDISRAKLTGRLLVGLQGASAVIDDFTRECLGLVVDTSLSGLRVGRELDRIVELRACRPAMVVSDNGTELTSHAILRWQEERAVLWHYIAPGKPQRTGSGKALTAGSGMNA